MAHENTALFHLNRAQTPHYTAEQTELFAHTLKVYKTKSLFLSPSDQFLLSKKLKLNTGRRNVSSKLLIK